MEFKFDFTHITNDNFEEKALELFNFQYNNNNLYRDYCQAVQINSNKVKHLNQIPFLPIQFFKTHKIKTGLFNDGLFFESSGTTGSLNSKHYVKDVNIYEESFSATFELFFGSPHNYCVLALLPSYLERNNASLVYMAEQLIKASKNKKSGFYLYELEKLKETILANEKQQIKTLLIGVSFALIDFAEKFPMPLQNCMVMETGGMKGRRKEITRSELHDFLKNQWQLTHIYSEYGMTELLSQAYAKKDGVFYCPPWMKVLVRAEDDPLETLTVTNNALRGALNIIDLANIYSCAFIATEDVGLLHADGGFEVYGRLDVADIRGCSLMVP